MLLQVSFVIVNVCLFLYRQACRYLLIYVIFFLLCYGLILLYLKLSVFLLALVLVSVTRVLALCRDGSKQMSDLPFLSFFY